MSEKEPKKLDEVATKKPADAPDGDADAAAEMLVNDLATAVGADTPANAAAEVEPEAEPEAEPDPDASAEEGAESEQRVEALETENENLNDKLLRALAEAENVRRRAVRDREDAAKYAIANFAREILTVADNVKRALASADADTADENDALKNLIVGLEMIEREMLATFERFGIASIDALGQKFDHNLHEAMFEIDNADQPTGTVIQVLETGYMLNDRLLRPAKVGVTKGSPKETEPADVSGDADHARDSQQAYESKGEEPGTQLDEEL